MSIEHVDVTSIHRFAYVSNSDPGAVGANKGWVDTSGSNYIFKIRNAGNTAWNVVSAVYTGSNIGTGIGVFKQVNGTSFEFKKIEGGTSSSIAVIAHPTDTDSIAIDVVPANITLTSLSGNLSPSRITASAGSVLFGRYTASSGNGQEITIGDGLVLNTTTGILGTAIYSIYTTADITVGGDPVHTQIVQTPNLGGVGTYAIDLYIPVDNGVAVAEFYITTTASLDYYIADWAEYTSADAVSGAPTIRTMQSFDPTDIFTPSGLESTTGYITAHITAVVGVNGKLTLFSYYTSILSVTSVVKRGARITINKIG